MVVGYVIVALLATGLAVFALQNTAPTSIHFLVWSADAMPVSALILLALAAGVILGGVPLWIQRWRLRSRARALELRIAELERSLAEREQPRGGAASGA
jgi:uncharacterized integral membrane protein